MRGSRGKAFAAEHLGTHYWNATPFDARRPARQLGGGEWRAACPIGVTREFRKTECNYLNWNPAKVLGLQKKKKKSKKKNNLNSPSREEPNEGFFLFMIWQRGAFKSSPNNK